MTNNLNNAKIIDVRSPGEFAVNHFPGAVNIPLDQIEQHINELQNLGKPIVVYCKSGTRSGMAVSILKQHDVKEVYNGGALQELLRNKNRYHA